MMKLLFAILLMPIISFGTKVPVGDVGEIWYADDLTYRNQESII
jgi:hypothetical protein